MLEPLELALKKGKMEMKNLKVCLHKENAHTAKLRKK